MNELHNNIWLSTIVNGLKGLQYPLSVQEDAYAEEMTPMECDIAATLLEQDALRMIALARYLRVRGYPQMNHEEAVAYRDNVMQIIRLQLEVS